MPISQRQVGTVTVVDLSGKLQSGEEGGKLKETVTSLFVDHKQVIVNLGGVTYIDSCGLGELVSCLATARKAEGVIKLANLGKRVQDLMIMTKLLNVFDVYDTEADAIASFSK